MDGNQILEVLDRSAVKSICWCCS